MRVESDYYAEDAQRRERCLSCALPQEFCYGEENCLAENRLRQRATKASIMYGIQRGESQAAIAKELFLTRQYVNFVVREAST